MNKPDVTVSIRYTVDEELLKQYGHLTKKTEQGAYRLDNSKFEIIMIQSNSKLYGLVNHNEQLMLPFNREAARAKNVGMVFEKDIIKQAKERYQKYKKFFVTE